MYSTRGPESVKRGPSRTAGDHVPANAAPARGIAQLAEELAETSADFSFRASPVSSALDVDANAPHVVVPPISPMSHRSPRLYSSSHFLSLSFSNL